MSEEEDVGVEDVGVGEAVEFAMSMAEALAA